MQGKIPNANRTAAAKLLQHPNVADLLQSIHPERIVETDFSRFRFERVILLGDPDADGLHASVLLVLLLSTKLPELINQGRCFMVRAPLYGFFQNEKCVAVAYSDKHAATVEKALSERYTVPSSRRRFKGIASLDSDLRSRLMRKDNPTRRQLLMDECRELCQMLFNQ